MSFSELINGLRDPGAYPYSVSEVEVKQTHISVVFLAGSFVYKVKKPLRFDFVDYSTLERRRYFCQQEVRLNRRLAPDTYLGVVPVVKADDRGYCLEGDGPAVEWAVKMRRLPADRTMESLLKADELSTDQLTSIAEKIAVFHDQATPDTDISGDEHFQIVANNVRGNFQEEDDIIGDVIPEDVFYRIRNLTNEALHKHRARIAGRTQEGIPRDVHGDLRLDHVYLLAEDDDQTRIVIVDCVEFNDELRIIDPVADIAFLAMDLMINDHRGYAERICQAYFSHRGDNRGRELFPFYVTYRSAVRAKVLGLKCQQEDIPLEEREDVRKRARAHWLLSLSELESPDRRPGLVLLTGLPATGKSTVARYLVESLDFEMIDTDLVRKEYFGRAPDEPLTSEERKWAYSPDGKRQVYAECLTRARELVRRGKRVVVEGTFHRHSRRKDFVQLAREHGIRWCLIELTVSDAVARQRLLQREDGPSEAGWEVYQQLTKEWEQVPSSLNAHLRTVDAGDEPGTVYERVRSILGEYGLASEN